MPACCNTQMVSPSAPATLRAISRATAAFRPTAVLSLLVILLAAVGASAATVTLQPVADNSLYHGDLAVDPTGTFEDNSCGAGPNVFSGVTTRDFIRRALLRFDIAGNVPAGSTIDGATLTLNVNLTTDTSSRTMTLHPVLQDWGEGSVDCQLTGGGKGDEANPGDATWLDAKFQQTPWITAGGDFGASSASATVSIAGDAVWDAAAHPAMVADLQSWLDTPAGNHGWIVVGDEIATPPTIRRFGSREGTVPPVLVVDFTPPAGDFACCFANGDCALEPMSSCSAQGGTPDPGASSCELNPCPQPIGACCNLEETCSDPVARDVCESAGGVFQGGGSACTDPGVDCGLEPFVDALPIPSVLSQTGTNASGEPTYQVSVVEANQQLHSELPPTPLWTYNGTFPGPTIEADVDAPIEVTYANDLPPTSVHALTVDECPHGPNHWQNTARVVTHLHGGHVPSRFDGQPEYHMLPGESDVYRYPNHQLPATLWYHDHAMGITRLNVYMGLAGYYILRDAFETSLGLPDGAYELPLVLQDRLLNQDATLYYPDTIEDAFYGDKILVNGKVWPYHDVKQGKYRLRILNGSQARVYTLELEDPSAPTLDIPFQLIGTDGGLIDAPIALDTITLTPAERLDVVVDFAGFAPGTEIILRNRDPRTPTVPNVMKFVVENAGGFTGALPGSLRPVTPIPEGSAALTRRFQFVRSPEPCAGGIWRIRSIGSGGSNLGEKWDDLSEFPILGDTEIWEITNATDMMHPFHMHLVMFQILDRTDLLTGAPLPLEPWEAGTWKDTVAVADRTRVRVIMKFEDHPGRFAYHCHILDHEDHEMMRQFQTVHDTASCTPDGVCDVNEDCVSCPQDCALTSGALCGNGLCEIGDGEDCVSCPADCAGDQAGGSPYCCGDGDGLGPIANCGYDVDGFTLLDDRCTTNGFFCRRGPRLSACCGDALCEGQESLAGPDYCSVDCTPAPEPGKLSMLVAGITALAILERRRRVARTARPR
jgi:spore coat protein A